VGVGGDEGGICYVGPPAEAEPTVAEGSKGEGGADGVEGVGDLRRIESHFRNFLISNANYLAT
jgi:hypothetical protein